MLKQKKQYWGFKGGASGTTTTSAGSKYNTKSSQIAVSLVERSLEGKEGHHDLFSWPTGSVRVAYGREWANAGKMMKGEGGKDERFRKEETFSQNRSRRTPSSDKSRTKFSPPQSTSIQIFYLFLILLPILSLKISFFSITFSKSSHKVSCFFDVVLNFS